MLSRCTYEDWRNGVAADVTSFTVTLRYQHPAHDQRDGITWDIEAGSKAEAIRKARKIAERDGYYWAKQGRMTFTARPCNE